MAPRALRRGVAEAEERWERRCVGDDMVVCVYKATFECVALMCTELRWGEVGENAISTRWRVPSQCEIKCF